MQVLPLLASFALAGSDPHWLAQESGSEASLRGLHAVSSEVCWASGTGGTVLRTTDGETWKLRGVAGAEELDFRDVHAFDEDRAVVLSAGSPARVYVTSDGGESWELTYENDHAEVFFDAFDFWDERSGIAFSDPIDGKLLLIETGDGGRSWSTVDPSLLRASPEGEAGFAASGTCLTTGPEGRVWIGLGGTAGARVVRRAQAGAWSATATPLASGESSTGVFSIAFSGPDFGVAVGGDYQVEDRVEGNAAVTRDGGATWHALANPPTGYRSCVARLSGGEWIAVGPSGSDISDDGESWRRFSETGYHVVSAAPDGGVFAAGSGGRIARLERGTSSVAARWNRFRGPNGTGVAEGGPYPAEIGPETNVHWKRPFPPGHSSPVLSRSRVFLTGVEDEKLFTYALDRASGESVWKRESPRPRRTKFHAKNHAAAASAAVDDETVAIFFDEYGLLAYDHDGGERWRVPLGPFDNVYGMGASPILVDGVVVLACDQSQDSFVAGFSAADGKELWRTARPRAVSGHCTPIVHRNDQGGASVLLPGSFLLDAYDALSGERLWWVRGLPSEMKSVPVLAGDVLWIHGYASPLNDRGKQIHFASFEESLPEIDDNADGRVSAEEIPKPAVAGLFMFFDLDADGSLDEPEWESMRAMLAAENAALALRVGGKGDVTDTNVLWRYHRSIPQLPSPLVYADRYYMLGDQGGLITLLAPETGEALERGRLTAAVDAYYASPVAADGKVYLLSESGLLTVLAAGGGLEPLHTADFGEPCYATPALEAGSVWLRTDGHLYRFQ